jgi:uncharacterized protein YdiU (UPF0061 family)
MLPLSNSYLQLPPLFYQRVMPTPVRSPTWVVFNDNLSSELGLNGTDLSTDQGLAIFAGNTIPDGSEPLALAYSGHQFGHFVPILGDGRAVLLGELTSQDGTRHDLQLKGAGRTPFSRRGDGRAALGPMMREYIIGEALHALGIPATRTLAVVSTGETVLRERPLPGGIQTRIARSHIRVGTFEYAAAQSDRTALQALADYVIARHYPEVADAENRYFLLAQTIFERQAALVAAWMHVGFIHGVMNTDNVAVSGESIDFGPCAFMNRYDPSTVFSSIDQHGRYAYGAQPGIIQWNLARLAESLIPLLHDNQESALEKAQALVDIFPSLFTKHWTGGMQSKLGLRTNESEDSALIKELLEIMLHARLDYTGTFRAISGDPHLPLPEAILAWHTRWSSRIDSDRNGCARHETLARMQRVNPAVIARNHLVEEALTQGVEHGDYGLMTRLVEALRDPFTAHESYSAVPLGDDQGYQTFCGT